MRRLLRRTRERAGRLSELAATFLWCEFLSEALLGALAGLGVLLLLGGVLGALVGALELLHAGYHWLSLGLVAGAACVLGAVFRVFDL